jgi:hypothetical protein
MLNRALEDHEVSSRQNMVTENLFSSGREIGPDSSRKGERSPFGKSTGQGCQNSDNLVRARGRVSSAAVFSREYASGT